MNPIAIFVLGLLVGWLIEWIIDYFFWRRNCQSLRAENIELRRRLAEGHKDDLEAIDGIGPVIAGQLNEASIFTFEQLGALDADRLREIVGDLVQRLADEDDILAQARELAKKKNKKS